MPRGGEARRAATDARHWDIVPCEARLCGIREVLAGAQLSSLMLSRVSSEPTLVAETLAVGTASTGGTSAEEILVAEMASMRTALASTALVAPLPMAGRRPDGRRSRRGARSRDAIAGDGKGRF